MSLATRDIKIDILRQVLQDSLESMNNKSIDIQTTSKENAFLIDIANDYSKYNTVIKKQKMDQIAMFDTLSQYISKISETMDKTDNVLRQSKKQQHQIMGEIHRLRKELDDII